MQAFLQHLSEMISGTLVNDRLIEVRLIQLAVYLLAYRYLPTDWLSY